MLLVFAKERFYEVFGRLVELWPADGVWDEARQEQVKELSRQSLRVATASGVIKVDTCIDKDQLRVVGARCAAYAVPWKFQKFFDYKGKPSRSKALKLRPMANIPVTLNGVDTMATINTVRRTRKYGNPHYIRVDMTVDTQYIPVILERETRCTCLYCGTEPVGDEVSCRSCGAPLPPC